MAHKRGQQEEPQEEGGGGPDTTSSSRRGAKRAQRGSQASERARASKLRCSFRCPRVAGETHSKPDRRKSLAPRNKAEELKEFAVVLASKSPANRPPITSSEPARTVIGGKPLPPLQCCLSCYARCAPLYGKLMGKCIGKPKRVAAPAATSLLLPLGAGIDECEFQCRADSILTAVEDLRLRVTALAPRLSASLARKLANRLCIGGHHFAWKCSLEETIDPLAIVVSLCPTLAGSQLSLWRHGTGHQLVVEQSTSPSFTIHLYDHILNHIWAVCCAAAAELFCDTNGAVWLVNHSRCSLIVNTLCVNFHFALTTQGSPLSASSTFLHLPFERESCSLMNRPGIGATDASKNCLTLLYIKTSPEAVPRGLLERIIGTSPMQNLLSCWQEAVRELSPHQQLAQRILDDPNLVRTDEDIGQVTQLLAAPCQDDLSPVIVSACLQGISPALPRFLRHLDLSGNPRSCLLQRDGQQHPLDVLAGSLMCLERLDLSSNALSSIPDWIYQLPSLRTLLICNNRLDGLWRETPACCNLEELDVSGNQLTRLPSSIGSLTNLKVFNCARNTLVTLPQDIGTLTKLEELHVSNNQLLYLPTSIATLSNLQWMQVSGNRFTEIMPDDTDLLAWFQPAEDRCTGDGRLLVDLAQGWSRVLHRFKIAIVGDGKAGKTSLLNNLVGEPHKNPPEKTTWIQRHGWCPSGHSSGCSTSSTEVNWEFDVWDFPGQPQHYATHNLFLSNWQCVYIIVIDISLNNWNSRLLYWVTFLQSKSSLIIDRYCTDKDAKFSTIIIGSHEDRIPIKKKAKQWRLLAARIQALNKQFSDSIDFIFGGLYNFSGKSNVGELVRTAVELGDRMYVSHQSKVPLCFFPVLQFIWTKLSKLKKEEQQQQQQQQQLGADDFETAPVTTVETLINELHKDCGLVLSPERMEWVLKNLHSYGEVLFLSSSIINSRVDVRNQECTSLTTEPVVLSFNWFLYRLGTMFDEYRESGSLQIEKWDLSASWNLDYSQAPPIATLLERMLLCYPSGEYLVFPLLLPRAVPPAASLEVYDCVWYRGQQQPLPPGLFGMFQVLWMKKPNEEDLQSTFYRNELQLIVNGLIWILVSLHNPPPTVEGNERSSFLNDDLQSTLDSRISVVWASTSPDHDTDRATAAVSRIFGTILEACRICSPNNVLTFDLTQERPCLECVKTHWSNKSTSSYSVCSLSPDCTSPRTRVCTRTNIPFTVATLLNNGLAGSTSSRLRPRDAGVSLFASPLVSSLPSVSEGPGERVNRSTSAPVVRSVPNNRAAVDDLWTSTTPSISSSTPSSTSSSSSSSVGERSIHSNAPRSQPTPAASSSMASTSSSGAAASMASAEVPPPKPPKQRSVTEENSAMWDRAQQLRAPTHRLLARLETELPDIKTSVAAQLNKRVNFGGQVAWTCDFYLGGSASHNVVTSSAKANDLDVLVILKPSGAELELDQYLCSLSNAGGNIPIEDARLELFWQAFSQGVVLFANQYQGALKLRQFELDGQTSFVKYELDRDRQMRCAIELEGSNTSVDLLPAFETPAGLHLILRRQVGQMFTDQDGAPVYANIVKSFPKLAVRRIAKLPDKGRLMICAMKHVKAIHKLKVPSCLFEAVVLEYFDKNNFLGLKEDDLAIWGLPFITIWENCWHRIVSWEPIAAPGAALEDENLFESIERKSLQTAQQLRTLARHLELLDGAAVAALGLTLPNKPRAEQDELALLEELNKMPVHAPEHNVVEAVVVLAE